MDEKDGMESTSANEQTTEGGLYVERKAGIRSNTVRFDRILEMAPTLQRRQMTFFNYEDGKKLRLVVEGHSPQQQSFQSYYSLCRLKHTNKLPSRRTVIRCSHCFVHPCVKKMEGYRKSCWDLWNSFRHLGPRKGAEMTSTNAESQEILLLKLLHQLMSKSAGVLIRFRQVKCHLMQRGMRLELMLTG